MAEISLSKREVMLTDKGAGHGRIVVDGVDMSNVVQGFDVTTRAGEASLVVLHLPAPSVVAKLADAEVRLFFAEELEDDPIAETAKVALEIQQIAEATARAVADNHFETRCRDLIRRWRLRMGTGL